MSTRLERAEMHVSRPGPREGIRNILCRGGRTGRKIHASSSGSSVTQCGHWMKYAAQHFEVSVKGVREDDLCERCFPDAPAAAKR